MAARKRSRERFEDEELEVESASSSFQASTAKRPRTVLAAENGGSVVSDEDDDEDESRTAGGASRFTSVAPSELQDDNNGIDEVLGTQIIHKQFRQFKENKAEECGIIEEVFCRNFMCHSKLRIRLGPLINFIIGHNGSGKSAVLTALTMCLGGKAANTNRGSSLKSMIKEGEETATLAVKIKNQGDGAFRPDIYGRSITVERHFSKAGNSGFKLKNADDRLVSTKKKDLDELIDFFSLQLDNPINVLNQDMARQFLSNSSANEKYKFFIKGTQLEMLDKDYRLLEERLDSIQSKLDSHEDDIVQLKQTAEEAEKKKKRLDATDTVQLEVQKARRQFAWAQVAEQEEHLEKCDREVARAEAAVQAAEQSAEQKSDEFEGEKNTFDQAKEEVRKIQEEQLDREQNNFNTLKETFDDGTNKLRDMLSDLRQGKEEYKTVQNRRRHLDEQIRVEQERLDAAADGGQSERISRLQELEQIVQQAKDDLATHEHGLAALLRDKEAAAQAMEASRGPVQDKQRALDQAKDKLERLHTQQRGRFGAYRRGTERLVAAVDSESRWRSKPVGPMGQYIRVRKPEWTGIVEKLFGANLEAWVVSCHQDRIQLEKMMKQFNCVNPVLVGDSEPLDVSNGEPEGDVDTILRILDFQHPMVRNQAIINQAIEQIVLIPDRNRGNDYMYSNPRPRNVRAVLTFNNTRGGGGFRLDCMRSGAPRLSPIQAWRGASRLQVDQKEQIRTHQEDVDQAKLELNGLERQKADLQRQVMAASQAVERHRRQHRDLVHGEQSASDDLQALQEELERNKPQDGRLQELQRQMRAAQEEEEGHRNIVAGLVRARTTQDEEQKTAKEQMDDAFGKVEKVRNKLQRAQDHQNRSERSYHTALRAKNEAFAAIADTKQLLEDANEARRNQERVVREEFTPMAEEVCPRVPVEAGITPQMLDDRLARFARDLERFEEEAGGTREEITEAWRIACVNYNDARKAYHGIVKAANTLKKALSHRMFRWDKFRSHISYRAQTLFTLLLSERQFRGKILMDHDNKTLSLSVEPDLTRASDRGREANTLSGGEKSFSTICLLLSIWEAMGSPIRCLDEFDVFMDSANRAQSMTMMIQGARRSVGRQFILITPQSMQSVQLGDDVRIHRMSDPERGQQALPFTQA